MSVVCSSLFEVCCSLIGVCPLSLRVVRCALFNVRCVLFLVVVCCALLWCVLFVLCWLVCDSCLRSVAVCCVFAERRSLLVVWCLSCVVVGGVLFVMWCLLSVVACFLVFAV